MRDVIGLVLIAIFAAFAVLQATTRDRIETNEANLKSLAKQPLVDAKPQSDDWPAWRGPLRDGIVRERISTTWPDDGPPKLWEQPTGEGYSSVAVAEGLVFAFFQFAGDETLVAYDRLTGQERWRFRYPAYYKNNYGNGPRSTPTIDGDRVYIVGGTGLLHCVDVKTGQKRWGRDLLKEFDGPTPKWGIAFSPLVDGDRLIVTPGGKKGTVVALDKTSGDVIWTALDVGGGYSSPILADIAGQRQIVAFMATGLAGLDPSDGKVLWQFPWTTSWDCNVATPIIAGDYVFITSGYDEGCALVHVQKGDKGWQAELVYKNKKMCSHFASCVRFGDSIYGFNESTLIGMNLRTGDVLWKQRGFGKGSVLGVGERLLVLGETGNVVLADVSPKFREVAAFRFSDDRCWSVPTIAHGLLYLRDQKTLTCFDVRVK